MMVYKYINLYVAHSCIGQCLFTLYIPLLSVISMSGSVKECLEPSIGDLNLRAFVFLVYGSTVVLSAKLISEPSLKLVEVKETFKT